METILIKDVRIVDLDKQKPSPPTDIFVQDGRIDKIGQALPQTNPDTRIISAKGLFALSGLIDCHAHPFLADTNIARLNTVPPTLMAARASGILNRMLMRGFTSIRDASGADWGIKQAVEEDEIIGPRLFIAGRALSQTGGHGDFRTLTQSEQPCHCAHALAYTSRIADGVDEVRKAVREELRQGADQIKIMVSGGVSSPHDPLECDQYSEVEIRVIVEEAARRGTYVMAHAYGASAIKTAVKTGVRTIEHGNLIDREAADLMAKHNAFLVPTLVTYAVLEEDGRANGWTEPMLDKLKTVRDAGLNSLELCKKAGVKIGLGTDLLGNSFDHQSREFLIRAEIETAQETIRSATQINAEILNRSDDLGQIRSGYIADMVLLNKDPLKSVDVFQNQGQDIPVILKAGHIYKNVLGT